MERKEILKVINTYEEIIENLKKLQQTKRVIKRKAFAKRRLILWEKKLEKFDIQLKKEII